MIAEEASSGGNALFRSLLKRRRSRGSATITKPRRRRCGGSSNSNRIRSGLGSTSATSALRPARSMWRWRPTAARSLRRRDRLAQSDPGNAGWQRDLSVSFENVGDVQVAQGDLARGADPYRDSLAIRDRLAKSDPGNTGWQRDLSVSYDKVGDVQVAQGNLPAALPSTATASRSPTAWRSPTPATPAGSAISRCRTRRLATCRWRRATSPAALTSYRDSLAIATAWRNPIPATPGWQRDLSVSHDKIGDVQVAQGDLAAR